MGERKRETAKEREREREKDEESMRIGKERKSPEKTIVPKLYAYNKCEHSVHGGGAPMQCASSMQ